MRKTVLWMSGIIAALVLGTLFPLGGIPVSENQVFNQNKILIEYEIYGCGSLVTRVVGGGEALAANLKEQYPDIATDEVVFTGDSDQPVDHLNRAEFKTAGLARGFRYVVYGEVVGVTQGAPACCEPRPAYNNTVAHFKVTRWAPTRYMPYFYYGDSLLAIFLLPLLGLCFLAFIIYLIRYFAIKIT